MVARARGELQPPLNLMSRRKQANPKPLKRKAEDELEELSELLQLPRDALVLQGNSEDEGDEEGEAEPRLQARVALAAGRLFGPYAGYVTRQAQTILPSEIKDAKLEIIDEGGQKLWVILKDETGSWMKLLKSSTSPENANLSIYSDGVTIWCSVTSAVEPEVELRAIYRGERPKGALNGDMLVQVKPEPLVNGEVPSFKDEEGRSTDGREEEAAHSLTSRMGIPAFPYGLQPAGLPIGSNLIYVPLQQAPQTSPRPSSVCSATSDQERVTVRGYICAPCGITFSSQRTLQAHQAYYCSSRGNTTKGISTSAQLHDTSSDQERVSERTTPKSGPASPARSTSASGCKRSATEDDRPSEDGATSDGEAPSPAGEAKQLRTSRVYQCPHCSYVTERKGGLTRHMRIHVSPPPAPGDQPEAPPAAPRSLSRYCSNCDIQFSSHKTFQVHKAYYCSTRHAPKGAAAAAAAHDDACSKTPKTQEGKEVKGNSGLVFGHPFYAAISTSPLILVPCSYLPGGGIAPAGGIISAGNIVVPNGDVSPVSPSPAFTVLPSPAAKPETAAVKVGQAQRPESASAPESAGPSGSEERPLDLSVRRRSASEEDSLRPASGPPKVPAPPSSPGLCGGAAGSLVPGEPVPSQILVKQGTSKCKECNIVFYKYENYLAHKRHYCASRPNKSRSGTSPETPKRDAKEREAAASPENAVSPGHHPTASQSPRSGHCPSPSGTQQSLCQYYCLACGITFTSLDNLQAHQTYYCSKREALAEAAKNFGFRCAKCKSSFSSVEVLKSHPCGLQRKCPYCDVFCPTLSAAQRHLVTHTGVKAFRCTICGYKGHTLRGMRTHIRIHLDACNGAPEENFIVCVGEDGAALGTRKNSDSSSAGSPADPAPDEVKTRDCPTAEPALNNSCDASHSCQFCGYTSSYKGNVVRHIKLVHRDFLSGGVHRPVSAGSPDKTQSSGDFSWTAVKKEAPSNDSDVSEDSRTTVKADDHSSPPSPADAAETILPDVPTEDTLELKNGPKYCKACDISFKHLSNFIAHKKYYCMIQPSDPVTSEPAVV